MGCYENDRSWSDKFIPAIRQIVGPLLLSVAPEEIDNHQAGDLVIMRGKNMTMACRVRRPANNPKYMDQFTIRYARASGQETEFSKIAKGFGDMMFYGWAADSGEPSFSRWTVIDLNAFRAHLILSGSRVLKPDVRDNKDGRSSLIAFDMTLFPPVPKLVFASSCSTSTASVQP